MFSQMPWPLVTDRSHWPRHNALKRERERERWVIQFVDKKVSWYGNLGRFVIAKIIFVLCFDLLLRATDWIGLDIYIITLIRN
jgi:hypothetical protein